MKYRIAIPTGKGYAFIYLIADSKDVSFQHYKYDEDTGDPETIEIDKWRIEFEDNVDVEAL